MQSSHINLSVGGMITLLPDGTDLNSIMTSGRYFVGSCVNQSPIGGWIFIDVMVRPGVPSELIQIVRSVANGRTLARAYEKGKWKDWV